MFEKSNMMKTNYLLEKSLDVESLRRKVIANNIANVDVPHFKRSEVNFESELNRIIDDNKRIDNKYPSVRNNPLHFPFYEKRDIRDAQPRVNLDYNTTIRNDGNNVDIEKELVDSSKNQMRYNAFITSLNNNYRMIKLVMRPA